MGIARTKGGVKGMWSRAFAALLVLVALLSGTVALADDEIVIDQDSGQRTADTLVTYDVEEGYELSIPVTVDLSEGAQSALIGATRMNLEPGHKVSVTVSSGVSDGRVTLVSTTDASATTATVVSLSEGGEGIADNATVATFVGANTQPTTGGTLYFSATPDDLQLGTYVGTITFSIAITDQ